MIQKNENIKSKEAFVLRDSALVTIATGTSVQNLRELKHALQSVKEGSIYHHFWGRLLHPSFDEPEYNNDFASWVQHSIHDRILAERLSVVNPIDFKNMNDLRFHLIDLIDERFDESELAEWKMGEFQFNFLDSQLLVLDTGTVLNKPEDLLKIKCNFREGSIYYHFIDARRRTDNRTDDFTNWLRPYGEDYSELLSALERLDPYFSSLKHICKMVHTLFAANLGEN